MSITIRATVNISPTGVAAKINRTVAKAMPEITNDICEDCNFYAPHRSGNLRSVANIRKNVSDDGATIEWTVNYAPYVYKGVTKYGRRLRYTRDPHLNPNAQEEWCKKAKQMHLVDWRKMLERKAREKYREQ